MRAHVLFKFEMRAMTVFNEENSYAITIQSKKTNVVFSAMGDDH